MKKLRVLHIIPSFVAGGAERMVVTCLENYDREKFEVAALSCSIKKDSVFDVQLERAGARIFYLDREYGGGAFGLSLGKLLGVNRLVKQFKPDIIHSHVAGIAYAVLPALINRVPVRLHTVHGDASWVPGKLALKYQELAFKRFGFIPVAISGFVRQTIRQTFSIKDVPLVYNGINTGLFRCTRTRGDDECVKLIHIGRFSHEKRHDLLIEAFRLVNEACGNVHLTLGGDGYLKGTIQEKVSALGLCHKVTFTGTRDDVPALLAQSDMFVLTSATEGFALVLLEAMAAGLPVVSVDCGGVPEVVNNGKDGILTRDDTPQGIADAVLKLVTDKALRLEIGERAVKSAACFDSSIMASNYEKLYTRLYQDRERH